MNIHRSCSCCVLVVLLAAVLLSGCAARVPYPADWEPMAGSAAGCQDLSGRFRDRPDIASHDEAADLGLPLTEIFFGSLLEGFEVTHLGFESLAGGGLRVTPWVGDTAPDASCHTTVQGTNRRAK